MKVSETVQRWVEFAALYVALPIVVAQYFPPWLALPTLCFGGFLAWWLLKKAQRRGDDSRGQPLFLDEARVPLRKALVVVLVRFAVVAVFLTALLYWRDPEALWLLPKTRPWIWPIIMISYPTVSVFPQAVIYRVLFVRRYSSLFAHKYLAWVVGALVFSLAHLMYRNVIAISFTFVAGLLFLRTYQKTQSLWLNVLEHGLYGDFIFTVGWGMYFFHGNVDYSVSS